MFVEKIYTLAGTSIVDGETTYRFACGNARVRTSVLTRNGHSYVHFWELPRPMVLKDAVQWLQAKGVYAVLPYGQRRGPNGKQIVVEAAPMPLEQQDAHVQSWIAAQEQARAKLADKRAKDAARKRAKRAAAKAAA